MDTRGDKGSHFSVARTQRRAAAPLHLSQRLRNFLIDHEFDSLESIAVADLRGLGLAPADAATVHAACAAASLSASRYVAAAFFSTVSPSCLRLPFALPPWRLFFRASSLLSSPPSSVLHPQQQWKHEQPRQGPQERQHKQTKEEQERSAQGQEQLRQQQRALTSVNDVYDGPDGPGDPLVDEVAVPASPAAVSACHLAAAADARYNPEKDHLCACKTCSSSEQQLRRQLPTGYSSGSCTSDASCSSEETASASEADSATETASIDEEETEAAPEMATEEKESRVFLQRQQHFLESDTANVCLPAPRRDTLDAEKAYATHSSRPKKCRSICPASTKGDAGSGDTKRTPSGCNSGCWCSNTGKHSSCRRKKKSSSCGRSENKKRGKSSSRVGREGSSTKRRRRRRRSSSSSVSSSSMNSESSSEGSELLQLLSQRRNRESAWCWSSGSTALDQLLGGGGGPRLGWRRRDVVEIYGPGGGAALTEVLLTCLVESLFASQRARVLLLSFRGGLPLPRLQQLLRYKVMHRMQERQAKQWRWQQRQQQHRQQREHQQQQPRQQHQAAEEAALFVSAAERRVQRLLRRVHVAHCFTLQDFGEALNQAEDVFAATAAERRARRAAAAARASSTAAVEASRRTGGKAPAAAGETFNRKRRCNGRSGQSSRSTWPYSTARPFSAAARATRSPAASALPSACSVGCPGMTRGNEKTQTSCDSEAIVRERGREVNLRAYTNGRRSRVRKNRRSSVSHGSSSPPFLAAAAVDGLPLLLIPFALLEGNAVLHQVCLRLRTFADACNALVLITNHRVVGSDSTAVAAASATAAAPDYFAAGALRCRGSVCSPRCSQLSQHERRDGEDHTMAGEEEAATAGQPQHTTGTPLCARCQILSSSAAPVKPALGAAWSRDASQVKLQIELLSALRFSPVTTRRDVRCWATAGKEGDVSKMLQQQRQPHCGQNLGPCGTSFQSPVDAASPPATEGFLLRITLVKSPRQAPGLSACVLLAKRGLRDLACSCAAQTCSSVKERNTSCGCACRC